jgi:uncharacterized membrane protein
MKLFAISGLILILIAGLESCYYDNEEELYHLTPVDCSTVNASFSQSVLPLITTKCATSGCHNASAAGGVVLQNYDQINAKADRIKQRVIVERTMPPGGGPTLDQANIISCWITNGKLNN